MDHKEFRPTSLAVDHKTTVILFVIVLALFGIQQYDSLPKEKFPEIVFPYYMVNTIHPGTSPADVENLITRPLEKHLKGIDGVKEISSNSIQDFSSIFIEFELSADDTRAYLDVKQAVDDARGELPADLYQEPEISRIDLSEIPIVHINLFGEISLPELKSLADDLQEQIEGLEEITRADIAGALDREIQVNVDLHKMQAAGIGLSAVVNAISAENMTMSGGQIDSDGMRRNLRIVGEFESVDQIGDILLERDVYLKDIAEVRDGFKDRESYARFNGENVVTLSVIKKSGKNLIHAVDKIKTIISEFRATAPSNLKIQLTGDSSDQTRNSVSDLFNTIILGFIVVTFVLMFFMGVTNALFVGVAIPLSIIIAFILLPVVNFTLNMVVLMSFILVLGIVVDNSIVVVENVYRHFMNTPNLPIGPATKRGVGEVAMPVFTGTLTTIAPFFPLIFTPGIPGKFMSYLPITVIITLSASLLVAYVVNPVFNVVFMRYRPREESTAISPLKFGRKKTIMIMAVVVFMILFYFSGATVVANLLFFLLVIYFIYRLLLRGWIRGFQEKLLPHLMNGYRKILSFFLRGRRPYLVIALIVVLFFSSFLMLGLFPPRVVFFPSGDPNTIYVYITMPSGTHIRVTDEICRDVEARIFDILGRDNPDVESVVSNVAVNAGSGMFDRFTQDRLAKVTIHFVEYKYRTGERSTLEYLNDLRRDLHTITGAEIRVDREAMGPPTGMPVNIEISGDELEELIDISSRLESFIQERGIQGIEDLKSSIEMDKPEMIVTIDREKANQLGIHTAQIIVMLRTAVYGNEASEFMEGEEEYPIQVRLALPYRHDVDALLSQTVTVPPRGNGSPASVPLSVVADIDYRSSYGGITRIDNKRVITLSSNVLHGYNPTRIIQQIRRILPEFQLKQGYSIQFTGEQDVQQETGQFMGKALMIAMALIFLILVSQFNSVAKPLIIVLQIFLSFTGVLLGFTLFRIEFSVMMTGMGIIAVAGVVVKNAIIIIDYTDRLIAGGMDRMKAVVEAGTTRLTPVLLTALSTILGLAPLAIGLNFNFETLLRNFDPQIYWGGDNAAFWNPLAWAIIFGLAFATVLTLIVVPALYKVVFLRERKK